MAADELQRTLGSPLARLCVRGSGRSNLAQRWLLHTHSSCASLKQAPRGHWGGQRRVRTSCLSAQLAASEGCTGDRLRNCKNTHTHTDGVCVCVFVLYPPLCLNIRRLANMSAKLNTHSLSLTHTSHGAAAAAALFNWLLFNGNAQTDTEDYG